MVTFEANDEILRMLNFILFFVDFGDMSPPVIRSDEVYAAF